MQPEYLEKVCILAIVERKQILFGVRKLVEHFQYFTALDHILVQFTPAKDVQIDKEGCFQIVSPIWGPSWVHIL